MALRGGDGGEAELGVEGVGVASDEGEAAEARQVRVGGDGFHEALGKAVATVGFEDVDVAEIGEGGFVGDYAGEGYLFAGGGVGAEGEGVIDGFIERGARDVFAPVHAGECGVDGGAVEAGRVGGYFVVHAGWRWSAETGMGEGPEAT